MARTLHLENKTSLYTYFLSLILFFGILPSISAADYSAVQPVQTEWVVRCEVLKESLTKDIVKEWPQAKPSLEHYYRLDVVQKLKHHIRVIKTALIENSKKVNTIKSLVIDFYHVAHLNSMPEIPYPNNG
jgi:hypothetical protein